MACRVRARVWTRRRSVTVWARCRSSPSWTRSTRRSCANMSPCACAGRWTLPTGDVAAPIRPDGCASDGAWGTPRSDDPDGAPTHAAGRWVGSPQRDLVPFLLYDDAVSEDPVLQQSRSRRRGRGLRCGACRLRRGATSGGGWSTRSPGACRSLPWVNCSLTVFPSAAGRLPGRPSGLDIQADGDDYRLLPAETQSAYPRPPRRLLGCAPARALRADQLPSRVRSYFEGFTDQRERLTPSWLQPSAGRLGSRGLRDFAVFLTQGVPIAADCPVEVLVRRQARSAPDTDASLRERRADLSRTGVSPAAGSPCAGRH